MTRRISVSATAAAGSAVLIVGGALFAAASPASAAAQVTRYVATTGDDGTLASPNDCTHQASPCATIQHAVDVASAGDTVSVGAGTYLESVTVPVSVTITGAGSSGSGRTTITGTDMRPGVIIDGTASPVEVALQDLEIADSADGAADGVEVGSNATVTITGSVITGNFDGVAIDGESGPGQLSVIDSVVDGNVDSGTIVNSDGSTADITGSTFDHNVGAAVVGDTSNFTLDISDSTLSNTQPFAAQTPGFGVGVVSFGGTTHIADSTITGNTGNGVLALFGEIDVQNSTVTDTQPSASTQSQTFWPDGGLTAAVPSARAQAKAARAVFGSDSRPAAALPSGSSLSVTATIDADNQVPDCAGAVTDGGYNLSGDDANSCAFSAAQHDLVQTDPQLGALADNGGPTLTQLPAADSPAVDVIPSGAPGCASGATDQRGVARPQPAGGLCDIGAVELAVAAPPSSSSAVSSSAPASPSASSSSAPPSSSSLPSTSTAPHSPNDESSTSLANTGARDVAALTGIGGGAVLLGVLALLGAAYLRRGRGRHSG